MATNTLNTRILLKYDTYANWLANDPILKAGELAIATVAANDSQGKPGFTNLPNVVLKVGDGTSHYSALKFVSALAADVHGWAKEATKPTYQYSEIEGLVNYVAGIAQSADTNTTYQLIATDAANYKYELQSKEINGSWAKAAELDLSGIVSRVKALEDKVGSESVATQIQNKIAALDAAKVTIGNGEILESVVETDGVVTVTKRALKAADFAADLIPESAVNGLTERLAGIDSAVSDAQGNALQDAKDYTDGKIQALDYNGGEFGTNKFATKVTEIDGVIAVEYAQPTIANVNGLETRLSGIEGNVTNLTNNKQDNLGFEGTYNKDTNKVVTKSAMTAAIQALDYNGGAFGSHKFATKVTEADGVIAVEYAQPAVADINGLSGEITRLDGRIDGKQDALTFTSAPNTTDNRVATEKYVANAVADLNGAMHFVGKLDAVPSENSAYSAGDVILVGYDEYVFDGTNWLALGNESIYQTKELATEQHNAITKQVTDLGTRHDQELAALTKKHNDELSALDSKYDGKLKALDYTDSAVTGQFVTAVSETDGVIAVTRAALKASDIPELAQSKITGLEKALSDLNTAVGEAESGALTDAKAYTDAQLKAKIEALDAAMVTAGQGEIIDSVVEADGVVAVTKRALVKADIPTIDQAQVNGLGTALAGKETAGAAAQALADAKTYADGKITALDYNDAAVAKNFVTEVKQADGVIAVKRAAVADIALTGNVNDLKQTTGDYLIFNCGSSSEVI